MAKAIFKPSIYFYEKFIKKQKEGTSFIIFFFFLLTFVSSRLWVYLAIKGIVPESFSSNVRGVHIHHFAYGIAVTTIICYLVLTLPAKYLAKWKLRLAGFFGIGMGWTFDEFAMWLKLEDEYWVRQSYDAIIILSLVFINIIYLNNFWLKLFSKLPRRPKPSQD
jgi:hypothetical protein